MDVLSLFTWICRYPCHTEKQITQLGASDSSYNTDSVCPNVCVIIIVVLLHYYYDYKIVVLAHTF